MRVAFFGGTFDPPHRGHLAIANAAAKKFSLDRILFAPVARQPLKDVSSASFADRLEMVRLLCAVGSDYFPITIFEPSGLDAPREDGLPNYTIDTLHRLREVEELRTHGEEMQLFAIVGTDAFLDLRRWKEPDALLEAAEWIVVSRPKFSLDDLAALALTPTQLGRVHLLNGVHEPASASEIRTRLKAGVDCSDVLTPAVARYIAEHGLYF